MGVDWGEKRIGLALKSGNFAEPYGVIPSSEWLFKTLKEEGIEKVVLGLPEGKHEKRVRNLGRKIEQELKIPVVLRSEILTSRLAQEKLIQAGKGKKARRELDAASAAFLLQEYLDEQAHS